MFRLVNAMAWPMSLAMLISLSVNLVAMPSSSFAQSLVYEREFTMVATTDNILRMELSADGHLSVNRPAFMTHSGRHELTLAASVYSQLNDQLTARAADSENLGRELQQKAHQELRYVSDPEISRFYRMDHQGRKLDHVSAISLEAWSRIYPDDQRLAGLRTLEQHWYEIMRSALTREDNQ